MMPVGMEISAAGMGLEKLRLNIASANISQMNNAYPVGKAIKPSFMVTNGLQLSTFEASLIKAGHSNLIDTHYVSIGEGNTKLVHEPNNPLANKEGDVEYADTNHLFEMMNVLRASRAYEANVKAFNAAKVMQEEALSIGR